MQPQLNFQQKRKVIKNKLGKVEKFVRECFDMKPEFIELKNLNCLVRFIWNRYDKNIPVGSITRCARKLRATGEFDTEENQLHRANNEVAYREHFKR